MGCWVSGCRGIRYLTPLLRSPKLLAVLNTPKMHGALRGTFATKETAPSKYAFDGAVYAYTRLKIRCGSVRT